MLDNNQNIDEVSGKDIFVPRNPERMEDLKKPYLEKGYKSEEIFIGDISGIHDNLKGIKIVIGNVFMDGFGLTNLVCDLDEVTMNFYCHRNKLTSLKGVPKLVGGDFYCQGNKLSSLEFSPKIVGGDFLCYENDLSSLLGSPEKVNGDFDCTKNHLFSLDGAPKFVGGDFDCQQNVLISYSKESLLDGIGTVKGKIYYDEQLDESVIDEDISPAELAKSNTYLSPYAKTKNKSKQKRNVIDHVEFYRSSQKTIRDEIIKLKWQDIKFKSEYDSTDNEVILPSKVRNLIAQLERFYEKYEDELDSFDDPSDYYAFSIDTEGKDDFYRTHFPNDLPDQLKGIGFGYKIYKALGMKLGHICSDTDASDDARRVWAKLVTDPDFNCIIIENDVLIINKKERDDEKVNIVKNWIQEKYSDFKDRINGLDFKLDTDLDKLLKVSKFKNKKLMNRYERISEIRRTRNNLFNNGKDFKEGDTVRVNLTSKQLSDKHNYGIGHLKKFNGVLFNVEEDIDEENNEVYVNDNMYNSKYFTYVGFPPKFKKPRIPVDLKEGNKFKISPNIQAEYGAMFTTDLKKLIDKVVVLKDNFLSNVELPENSNIVIFEGKEYIVPITSLEFIDVKRLTSKDLSVGKPTVQFLPAQLLPEKLVKSLGNLINKKGLVKDVMRSNVKVGFENGKSAIVPASALSIISYGNVLGNKLGKDLTIEDFTPGSMVKITADMNYQNNRHGIGEVPKRDFDKIVKDDLFGKVVSINGPNSDKPNSVYVNFNDNEGYDEDWVIYLDGLILVKKAPIRVRRKQKV